MELQFQAACVMLHEHPLNLEQAIPELLDLLDSVNSGTRRPIRLMDALQTVPFDPETAAKLDKPDLTDSPPSTGSR